VNLEPNQIDETTEVHECFNDVCCELSTDKSSLSCATHLGYYGPLCGGCDIERGYLRNGYTCSKCDKSLGGLTNYLALSGLIVGVLIVVIYIAAFRNTNRRVGEYGGIIRRIAYSYMQVYI
tara:strand:- start:93 stop:455 length:363 start_codon:yes stop_codon:yes gene_type:complete